MSEANDAPTFAPLPLEEQERMVEAMLFAASDPLRIADLAQRMPAGSDPGEAVARLRRRYEGRGVTLERVGDAFAFRTAPDLGFLMQDSRVESRRLSRAAIETLAIVAYHQPVTRTEIEELRGVAVARGTLDQLIETGWIRLGRRRMSPGRPVTFVVTEAFLDHFGLESAADLPGLSELRAAGLLDARPAPDGLAVKPVDPDMDDGDDTDGPPGDLFGEA
ncbi:SMC-Scp complex subunit ScpB [Paracoccus suum]|uniref:SMC-Scp complex subunit ScpB n=1 Tax=Paracoccus suum TaxID=2259340 RepID=A0A344PK78_9RHOB|nr:SMC-Scp complex subunit ScpB [Paracoccus suum]AXC49783.1 SMC-Scp complex subunit ScpB [Paracoccus suum]